MNTTVGSVCFKGVLILCLLVMISCAPASIPSPESVAAPAGIPSPESVAAPTGIPSPEGISVPAGIPSPESVAAPTGISPPEIIAGAEIVAVDEPRQVQLAEKFYKDISSIAAAVEAYRMKHGAAPESTDQLVAGGFLESVPLLGPEFKDRFGPGKYNIQSRYADMDDNGQQDGAIYSWEYIPEGVCVEFNKRYAQAPLNQSGSVFDYQAAGNKFPGQVYGRDIKVYAIKWKTTDDYCELNWVIDYN